MRVKQKGKDLRKAEGGYTAVVDDMKAMMTMVLRMQPQKFPNNIVAGENRKAIKIAKNLPTCRK